MIRTQYIHQRTRASLRISGPELDPEFWSEYFGVQPTSTAKAGDFVITRNGTKSTVVSKLGRWIFRCDGLNTALSIDEHILALFAALALPRSGFRELLQARNETCDVFVYVENEDGTNPPIYSHDIRVLVEQCGGSIDVDIYT
jgi:hypothetical protein